MKTVKQLAEIPINLLPLSLHKKVILPNIGRIEIIHKKKSPMYLSTIAFVKQFGPSIQYYNTHLKFVRTLSDNQQTPIIKLFDTANKNIEQVDSAAIKRGEEILQKIIEVNNKVNSAKKAEFIDIVKPEALQPHQK